LIGTFGQNAPSFQSRVVGVGHPVRAVADVRGADARSRERDTCEGVTHAFHVSVYKVDPRVDSLARNLLSKDDWRPTLRDEVLPGGPKMPPVCKPSAFTCRAERLARAAASPDGSTRRPSGKSQCKGPTPNSGEEMALHVSAQVVGGDILDAPFVYVASRDQARRDQVAQPLGGLRVEFVVVGGRGHATSAVITSSNCRFRAMASESLRYW
jgi:hypothetical protein